MFLESHVVMLSDGEGADNYLLRVIREKVHLVIVLMQKSVNSADCYGV